MTQEYAEGSLFDVHVGRMNTITCCAPQTIGVMRSDTTCDGHLINSYQYNLTISESFHQSVNNWPNGPMARRLTTIRSAIKRFQVRPLVRSSFLRSRASGSFLEGLNLRHWRGIWTTSGRGTWGSGLRCFWIWLGLGGFYCAVVVGMFVGKGIRAFLLVTTR
jgi:hypothetical protein